MVRWQLHTFLKHFYVICWSFVYLKEERLDFIRTWWHLWHVLFNLKTAHVQSRVQAYTKAALVIARIYRVLHQETQSTAYFLEQKMFPWVNSLICFYIRLWNIYYFIVINSLCFQVPILIWTIYAKSMTNTKEWSFVCSLPSQVGGKGENVPESQVMVAVPTRVYPAAQE